MVKVLVVINTSGTTWARDGHRSGTARHKHRGPLIGGPRKCLSALMNSWLRGQDLNLRPLGYEPNELPGCSTPHIHPSVTMRGASNFWALLAYKLWKTNNASLVSRW